MAVPITVTHLHDNLRQQYRDSTEPPVLKLEAPTVHTPYTPQQTNGWNCAMHMLLTSLSATYQGHLPIEDPEPHSKTYNAGGTEMPEHELARKA